MVHSRAQRGARNKKEMWLSGRKRFTANEVGFNRPRGFESHRLRKLKLPLAKATEWRAFGAPFCRTRK